MVGLLGSVIGSGVICKHMETNSRVDSKISPVSCVHLGC
jgi:hypothetical protein